MRKDRRPQGTTPTLPFRMAGAGLIRIEEENRVWSRNLNTVRFTYNVPVAFRPNGIANKEYLRVVVTLRGTEVLNVALEERPTNHLVFLNEELRENFLRALQGTKIGDGVKPGTPLSFALSSGVSAS